MNERRRKTQYPNPREEDIYAGDRRISRPDSALPDWYISDAKYRPIPIAWFAAAVLIQTVLISFFWYVLSSQAGWLTVVFASLATGAVFQWSWARGIGKAGRGWHIATAVVMVLQLALIIMGVSDRL